MPSLTLDDLRREAQSGEVWPSLTVQIDDERAVTFRNVFLLDKPERTLARERLAFLSGEDDAEVEQRAGEDLERSCREVLVAVADDPKLAAELLEPMSAALLLTVTRRYVEDTGLGEAVASSTPSNRSSRRTARRSSTTSRK